jgi:uncharacterized protein with GYD domain
MRVIPRPHYAQVIKFTGVGRKMKVSYWVLGREEYDFVCSNKSENPKEYDYQPVASC